MWANVIVLFNIILLESLLSVDNAAVLALMVKDLPDKQKKKALKYGMVGAFIFRGLSLLLVGILASLWPLKIAAGIYLLYLAIGHFTKIETTEEIKEASESNIFKWASKYLSKFWATVVLVEWVDMVFSLDNIFAAVGLSKNMGLVVLGVCIGIFLMRITAQGFVWLMDRYPSLEKSAFYVIFLLGVKLFLSGWCDWPWLRNKLDFVRQMGEHLESHQLSLIFSLGTLLLFALPIFLKREKKVKDIN